MGILRFICKKIFTLCIVIFDDIPKTIYKYKNIKDKWALLLQQSFIIYRMLIKHTILFNISI